MSQNILWKKDLLPVLYGSAVADMTSHAKSILEGKASERVWLLEHPHTFTMGSSADPSDLVNVGDVPVYETGRGGKVTYHGPGQRIAYVQLNLKNHGQDVRKYVWMLEEWIIQTLQHWNIKGERRDGRIGIWVATQNTEKKIAAVGVRVQKWITLHGVAININPDLSYFDKIVPCGIQEFGVTSLSDLGVDVSMEEFDQVLQEYFDKVFLK